MNVKHRANLILTGDLPRPTVLPFSFTDKNSKSKTWYYSTINKRGTSGAKQTPSEVNINYKDLKRKSIFYWSNTAHCIHVTAQWHSETWLYVEDFNSIKQTLCSKWEFGAVWQRLVQLNLIICKALKTSFTGCSYSSSSW